MHNDFKMMPGRFTPGGFMRPVVVISVIKKEDSTEFASEPEVTATNGFLYLGTRTSFKVYDIG